MLPLSDTIFLRSVRTSGQMDNIMISAIGKEKGLDKLDSTIDTKNFLYSGILSDNLRDKVDDYSNNFRVIVEKVDPTLQGVFINKHDIVAMT